MKFSRVRKVKSPVRSTFNSAGIDFFVPEFNEQFLADLRQKNKLELENNNIEILQSSILLKPQGRILIPSGIHVNLDDVALELGLSNGNDVVKNEDICSGVALIVYNKSGVGSKLGLDRLAEVIDQDYQGEIHLNVVNTGTTTQKISQDDKLVQMILTPVFFPKLIEIPVEELYTEVSERGTGGFGSTDNL